jgi:hypothetical protein
MAGTRATARGWRTNMTTRPDAPDLILHSGLFTTLDRLNPTTNAVTIKNGGLAGTILWGFGFTFTTLAYVRNVPAAMPRPSRT